MTDFILDGVLVDDSPFSCLCLVEEKGGLKLTLREHTSRKLGSFAELACEPGKARKHFGTSWSPCDDAFDAG